MPNPHQRTSCSPLSPLLLFTSLKWSLLDLHQVAKAHWRRCDFRELPSRWTIFFSKIAACERIIYFHPFFSSLGWTDWPNWSTLPPTGCGYSAFGYIAISLRAGTSTPWYSVQAKTWWEVENDSAEPLLFFSLQHSIYFSIFTILKLFTHQCCGVVSAMR